MAQRPPPPLPPGEASYRGYYVPGSAFSYPQYGQQWPGQQYYRPPLAPVRPGVQAPQARPANAPGPRAYPAPRHRTPSHRHGRPQRPYLSSPCRAGNQHFGPIQPRSHPRPGKSVSTVQTGIGRPAGPYGQKFSQTNQVKIIKKVNPAVIFSNLGKHIHPRPASQLLYQILGENLGVTLENATLDDYEKYLESLGKYPSQLKRAVAQYDGKTIVGLAPTQKGARERCLGNVFPYILAEKCEKQKRAPKQISSVLGEKLTIENMKDEIPFAELCSYALHKLLADWKEEGVPITQYTFAHNKGPGIGLWTPTGSKHAWACLPTFPPEANVATVEEIKKHGRGGIASMEQYISIPIIEKKTKVNEDAAASVMLHPNVPGHSQWSSDFQPRFPNGGQYRPNARLPNQGMVTLHYPPPRINAPRTQTPTSSARMHPDNLTFTYVDFTANNSSGPLITTAASANPIQYYVTGASSYPALADSFQKSHTLTAQGALPAVPNAMPALSNWQQSAGVVATTTPVASIPLPAGPPAKKPRQAHAPPTTIKQSDINPKMPVETLQRLKSDIVYTYTEYATRSDFILCSTSINGTKFTGQGSSISEAKTICAIKVLKAVYNVNCVS